MTTEWVTYLRHKFGALRVEFLMLTERKTDQEINMHILVVAGDTLARHLQWLIEEPDSGLEPEVLAALRSAASKDLVWWENCVKMAGFKSPAAPSGAMSHD